MGKSFLSVEWLFMIVIGIITAYMLWSHKKKNNQRRRNQTVRVVNKRDKSKSVFSGWKVLIMGEVLSAMKMQSELKILKQIIRDSDVYILSKVESDSEEALKKKEIKNILFGLPQVPEFKILFCSTERGKIAIARSIDCNVFLDVIDSEMEKVVRKGGKGFNFFKETARFIPYLGCVNLGLEKNHSRKYKNIVVCRNVEDVFHTIGRR